MNGLPRLCAMRRRTTEATTVVLGNRSLLLRYSAWLWHTPFVA